MTGLCDGVVLGFEKDSSRLVCVVCVILFIPVVCVWVSMQFWMGHRMTSTAAMSRVGACVCASASKWETEKTAWRHSNIFCCCFSCKRAIIVHSVPLSKIYPLNYQILHPHLPRLFMSFPLFLKLSTFMKISSSFLFSSAVITSVSGTLNQLLMNSLSLCVSLSLSSGAWRSNLQLNSHSFCACVCVRAMNSHLWPLVLSCIPVSTNSSTPT